MPGYILAIDQGTTSSRTIAVDEHGGIHAIAQREFTQHYPQQGWVEHDANEIWETQLATLTEVLDHCDQNPSAIGITNQRETVVAWSKSSGQPFYHALVWQDQRTSAWCQQIRNEHNDWIKSKTGLEVDSYFSASKMRWLLENVEEVQSAAEKGDLAFGTIDSWLIWNLTGGQVHATDSSNASRTMLMDLNKRQWDAELLDFFGIPSESLPEIKHSDGEFGEYLSPKGSIPIRAAIGDQQSALFGQLCWDVGDVKNTYGTGCFMLSNAGDEPVMAPGLLSSVAWSVRGKTTYCLEGGVFIGGAVLQWLRDEVGLIDDVKELEELIAERPDKDLTVVPAFAGLGAPHWNMNAKGSIFGLTRDINKADLCKAALESIAFQSADLLLAMKEAGLVPGILKVDGGASANNYLMQFQSDIIRLELERPESVESTALGAAYMAGIACGMWDEEMVRDLRRVDRVFTPQLELSHSEALLKRWNRAVKATMTWAEGE